MDIADRAQPELVVVSKAVTLLKDPCPIQEGTPVYRGWKDIFWRRVAEIHFKVRVKDGWIVLVEYKSGRYELLRYVFGDGKESYDHIERVREGDALLRKSATKPQVMDSAAADGLCLLVTDRDLDGDGKVIGTDVYEIHYAHVLDTRHPVQCMVKPHYGESMDTDVG